MNIKKNLEGDFKEMEKTKDIIKFFDDMGLGDDINNIISPLDENPTITFKATTKKELKKILETLEKDTISIKETVGGCTGYNPLLSTEVLKDNETRLKNNYLLETKTDKYNSEQTFQIRFFISRSPLRMEKYFSIWLETKIEFFEEYYSKETIKDTQETERARNYNHKHEEITTTRPVFKNLTTTKFYGGNVTHYASNEEENKQLKKMLEMKK